MKPSLFVFVDVDDTLIRKHTGPEGAPMPEVAEHVCELYHQGAQIYCWSTGGADHARSVAQKLGIDHCFTGFLHKPQVFIDDERAEQWPHFVHVDPDKLGTLESYQKAVSEKKENQDQGH